MTAPSPNIKKNLIKRLQSSRNKLTPIVNGVIVSTVDVVHKGDGKIFFDRFLTMKQYEDMIHATSLLKEAEFKLSFDPRFHKLPNTDIVVYGMSKSKEKPVEETGIFIDEKTIISLLDIYEKIGVLIEYLSSGNNPVQNLKSAQELIPPKLRQELLYASDLKNQKNSSRNTIVTMDKEVGTSDTQVVPPAKSVSLVNWESTPSAADLEIKPKEVPAHVNSKKLNADDSKNFKIKIMCNMSTSDLDDKNIQNLPPSKSKDDCFRVKLGDKPVSVKTGCEDYYCIDAQTEDEEQAIRIIIKPCANCHGTEEKDEDQKFEEIKTITSTHSVNGKKSKRVVRQEKEQNFEESSQIQEEKDEQTVEESIQDITSTKSKSVVQIESEEEEPIQDEEAEESVDKEGKEPGNKGEGCDANCSPQIITINIGSCANCGCAEGKKPKMNLILDVDNVDQSSIKIYDERQEKKMQEKKIASEKKKLKILRERTCSSQELDVTKVKTSLRNQEIEHKNSTIVNEFRKLGVDQILRACRPAKCCRKAILNERQRTALPYCVSLKSLPLVSEDIIVIQESIEMSVKKIKNSTNSAENRKDKMSPKSDPFEANINFPLVLPIYRVTLDYDRFRSEERFYILKKIDVKKKNLKDIVPLKNKELTEKNKFYILIKCSKPEWMLKNKIVYKIVRSRRHFLKKKMWRSSVFEKVTKSNVVLQETTSFKDVVFAESSNIQFWSSLGFTRNPFTFKI